MRKDDGVPEPTYPFMPKSGKGLRVGQFWVSRLRIGGHVVASWLCHPMALREPG
jgi:hypothetical protein